MVARAAFAVATAVALSACSSTTAITFWIAGDDSLPRIRVLRAGLTSAITADKPCLDVVDVREPNGDVAPVPYVFQVVVTVPVDRNLAGLGILAVDGYSGAEDSTGVVDIGCATVNGVLQRTTPIVAGSEQVTVEAGADPVMGTVTLFAGSCGDAIKDVDEVCDDGNRRAGDTCDPTCGIQMAGDRDAGNDAAGD